MSKFYGRGSDSESESSSSESEDEQTIKKPIIAATAYDDLSDEDEESSKRVVRSAKEKRYEEIYSILKKIKNYRKNNDVSNILDCFEDLTRAHQKALPIIIKEEGGVTPQFYLRTLAQLEAFVNDQWERKKTTPGAKVNKSLGPLRQKLRKYNKDFEEELTKFRENPDLLEEDELEDEKEGGEKGEQDAEESGSSSSDEDTAEAKAKRKADRKKVRIEGQADKGGDESDDSYWDSSSESSSSSDDETQYASLREKFLKKPGKDTDKPRKEKEPKRREKRRIVKESLSEDDGPEWEVVNRGALAERPKMFNKDEEINTGVVVKKLGEITAVRGKKGTDRKEQIDLLVELESIANAHDLGPGVQLKIAFSLVAALFDYSLKVHELQKVHFWIKLLDKVTEMLKIAIASKEFLTVDEEVPEDAEVLDRPPAGQKIKIRGCLLTVFERMDEEFLKVLKELDSHSFEYVERVQDEKKVCEVLDTLIGYLESTELVNDKQLMCRAYYKKIEHLYYKFDLRVLKKKRGEYKGETTVDEIQRLAGYIYAKDTTDRLRTRAILCHIFHHALHNNWFEARDLLLMSHLQEVIQHSDPPTQIIYNRAIVQLGVCAFRHESTLEAHNCLSDLMMSARVKELLAQGLMPQHRHDRSAEQEKIERSRQVPFHMQLNLDVIECVYLVSAMLIEVPYIAEHEFDAKRRPISKTFYHQLRTLEKQSLTGPPESMREHVVAAARAMKKGDWKGCYNSLVNEKMDRKVWQYFTIYEYTEGERKFGVKDMLQKKIKAETLRTYLFTYSHVYDSISLARLGELYDLDYKKVHSIVAKMIINQELMASMDEPTRSVVLHRTEPTRLQSMLLQIADKVNILRETSDRSMETKIQGGPGTLGPGGKRFNRDGNWRGGRGRGRGGGHQQQMQQQQSVQAQE